MSLRLEMLQVARLGPKVLGDSAGLVAEFLERERNEDGGFKDRTGKSDLYYTVFGLDGWLALGSQNSKSPDLEQTCAFLASFDDKELDFVHLCCLARCWAAVAGMKNPDGIGPAATRRAQILKRIELFRTADGGYNPKMGTQFGTTYGCFLALGAYQDLKGGLPEPLRLVQCLKFLETEDGAWANERNVKEGSTNATAAAVTLLRQLNVPINQNVGHWLLARAHPEGGFRASPGAPIPDLLSTATALHALAGLEVSFAYLKEACLDFIDTLWTNEGGFHGHWGDDSLDCEYTFYGLLGLGHLSL